MSVQPPTNLTNQENATIEIISLMSSILHKTKIKYINSIHTMRKYKNNRSIHILAKKYKEKILEAAKCLSHFLTDTEFDIFLSSKNNTRKRVSQRKKFHPSLNSIPEENNINLLNNNVMNLHNPPPLNSRGMVERLRREKAARPPSPTNGLSAAEKFNYFLQQLNVDSVAPSRVAPQSNSNNKPNVNHMNTSSSS